ncbi:MAG: ABC transporter ATP-binding protein [Thermotogota bacterium]
MDCSLKVDQLSFGYCEKMKILKEVSLSVEKGEFVGILGPNGCGKSTLLKNIMNFFPPESGTVVLFGEEIQKMDQKKIARKMAYVPQKSGMHMALTVFETILMGRLPHLKNRWEGYSSHDIELVNQVIDDLNLEPFRDRISISLSGGEFQKVLLARALVQKPEILLLDEPTSNLDMNHAVDLMAQVKSLTVNSDLSAVAVLHDLNLASLFCDKVFFVNNGNIAYKGDPKAVFTKEIIKEIYKIDVHIGVNEAGLPYVIPKCDTFCKKKEMLLNVS